MSPDDTTGEIRRDAAGSDTRYRVLSLDGGGIRGLLTSTLIERLESARPGLLGGVDLLAGTSTGAILALALAAGLKPEAISDLYRTRGGEVFADSLWDLTDIDRLVRADYRGKPLRRVLADYFGDMRMGELGKKVVVATFDLDSGGVTHEGVRSWKAKFFHNFEEPGSHDLDELVADVAMRSCAAPTYFPIYQGFVDGGVVANNPSACALAQALHAETGGQRVADVTLLSVGTGANPRWVESQDGDWGFIQWAKPVIGIAMEGAAGVADYQCRQILDERYYRLQPVLPRPIPLDDIGSCDVLESVGATAPVDEVLGWLDAQYLPSRPQAQPAADVNAP